MPRISLSVTKSVASQILKHFKDAEWMAEKTAGAIVTGTVLLPFGVTTAMVNNKLEADRKKAEEAKKY